MGGVGGGGGDEGRRCACFIDAFLEQLTFLGFFVLHQHVVVNGFVQLSFGVVNTKLSEQRIHTEGASFIWDDGHHALAERFVFHQ